MKELHNKLLQRSRHYRTWHEHPLHRHVHWGLLGAVVVGVALSFVMLGWSEFETSIVARAQSSSCTHTVAKDGSGNFTSLQEAADAVTAGNVVCVKQGTYPGFHIRDKHGRADAWIVIKPYPGDEGRVILDSYINNYANTGRAVEISGSSYIEINSFEMTDSNPAYDSDRFEDYSQGLHHDGIKINQAYGTYGESTYIRIVNNRIFHIGGMGILSDAGAFNEFIGNEISRTGLEKTGYGMYIGGDDILIRGNRVSDASGYGLHLYSGHNSPDRAVVENNVFFRNGRSDWGKGHPCRPGFGDCNQWNPATGIRRGDGIIVWGGSGAAILNNTMYSNIENGILVNSLNAVIRNNVAYQNAGGEFWIAAGNTQDHNLFGVDPKFVNAASGDFHLTASSPAIDAGTSQNAPSTDFEGTARPQGSAWDIGADEFGAGTGSVCGRNGCEAGETASSCPQDCGSTQNQPPRNLVLRYLGPTPTGGIPATNCGNGTIQTGEQCDGANLNGQTCQTLGFQSGTPACYPAGSANQCTFNTSGCTSGPQCTPTAEVCDSKDNDCDSYIDEGNVCQPQGGHVRAFPTAEGYGALAKGGRGGRVIEVTNLNDSGPGSLREAVTATGPRIVVFRVGGTIELQSDLIIRGEELAYLTIAGQTAPGGGILLKKYGLHVMDTHDIIIRHLRIRTGFWSDGGASHGILVWGYEGAAHDVIFDHVSVSWIMDDNSIWGNTRDVTLQWSMFAEASTQGRNEYDCGSSGGCGLMWGPIEKVNHLSIHHNLLIHNYYRNPGMGGGEHQFINNVIYNPGWSATIMGQYGQAYPINIDFIGNYYQKGPDTRSGVNEILFEEVHDASIIGLHLEDNFGWNYDPNDPYALVQQRDYGKRTAPLAPGPFVPITIHGYEEAKDLVIQNVGATMPVRDAVDIRLVDEFNTGIGSLGIGSDFPMIANGAPPADSDHDGMPDAWETSHGLNPTNASDGPQDQDSDGYTNVEEYLNELAGD